jgi:hypothetical protein
MSAMMEKLLKEATTHTPMADFDPSGRLKLEGRSFPENVAIYFDPLINFVKDLKTDTVRFDVNLEYFNTASSKKLMDLFKHLDANSNINTVIIHWHYEEGDDDSLETAEIFEESLLRCEFLYHEYAETMLD